MEEKQHERTFSFSCVFDDPAGRKHHHPEDEKIFGLLSRDAYTSQPSLAAFRGTRTGVS